MNKAKRITAGVLVSVASLTGMGGVANAAPAEAYSKTSCYATMDYSRLFRGEPVWSCYYNFNWFEETFQGRKDGRYLSPRALLV